MLSRLSCCLLASNFSSGFNLSKNDGERAEEFMQIRVKYWMKILPKVYSVLVRVMKYAEDYL
jgi:hypothetical protein